MTDRNADFFAQAGTSQCETFKVITNDTLLMDSAQNLNSPRISILDQLNKERGHVEQTFKI